MLCQFLLAVGSVGAGPAPRRGHVAPGSRSMQHEGIVRGRRVHLAGCCRNGRRRQARPAQVTHGRCLRALMLASRQLVAAGAGPVVGIATVRARLHQWFPRAWRQMTKR